ncbi:arylsulfatase [Agromyces luteolus]|uniref:Sulfatase-like hydrolase/transferase n=1 Tax=Agromyces luteolus TaxID=88373 RepID=A0A7C9LC95_9MICO|nr:sulfatase-like hydrolase/transferase [Agromyces luteolus]MUN05771.1 sulfatase-like hydrolase/transferase [Agromyces luteolus]GLK26318.1 arylsulfatase [Agromyces luteolus]
MDGDITDVLVAGYQDLGAARTDFDGLVEGVAAKRLKIEGAILVLHDADGEITVADTGSHLGRKGAGWGAGVGVAVGLLSPPLLASVALGTAGGAVAGRFTEHRLTSGIGDRIGSNLPPGSAGIIAVFDASQRLAVEQALPGSPAKSVVESDRTSLSALKDALAEAMGKFAPDRTVLPMPDPAFGGTIGRTVDASVADWTIVGSPKPPPGSPNVLIVLIDDAGFGNPSTFGGLVDTPNMTRVQRMGLTYNRFHVTAICSPTRSALLTGRNQHRVGFGSIAEFPGPFPGYTASVPKSCAPLARLLKENGYLTGGFGKWHLTPDHVQGAAGPFDRWPTGWGFDHWWGFLSGAAGQYDPIVTQDNSTLGVPVGEDGAQYYFPDDLTDKAVEWLHAARAQDSEKPWFMYYSTGCAHAPHHVESEWADRYRGKFDGGWDEYRRVVFDRQKQLGVIPADAELTERPDLFPAWDSLSADERKLYARQMEVFAGYSENADWNVGRLLDAIDEMGETDDTLIFYIWGDNGASMEGTITGSFNELTFLNGIPLRPDEQLRLIEDHGGIEDLGGVDTAPHYAAAWGWAGNAPFQWGKQTGSHLGGTRDPMVVAWPGRIPGGGELRSQFTHCIDIGPTILEAIGLPEARLVDGVEQEPMDGTSFLYTFEDADAEERHDVQYFESFGSRAIYKDGWWACARLDRVPWDFSPATIARFAPGVYDPDQDTWELYYLPDDFSQANDLAAEHPERLAELKELFWQEAERNRVLPLLGGFAVFFGMLPPMPTHTRYTFAGDVQNVQRGMIPRIYGRSYAIEARLEVPEGGAEGVIVANADEIGGFALWMDGEGRLHHTYSMLGVEQYRQVSDRPVPTGEVVVRMRFDADEHTPGTGGDVTLWAGDEQIGGGRIDRTVPVAFSSYAGMDIGRDNGLVVDRAYRDRAPYAFTGRVRDVVFDLEPAPHSVEQRLHHESGATGMGAAAAG